MHLIERKETYVHSFNASDRGKVITVFTAFREGGRSTRRRTDGEGLAGHAETERKRFQTLKEADKEKVEIDAEGIDVGEGGAKFEIERRFRHCKFVVAFEPEKLMVN